MSKLSNRTFLRIIERFNGPLPVGAALVSVLALILVSYSTWLVHIAPSKETEWQSAVTEAPGGFMRIDIDMAGLTRKYRADHIASAKTLADQYLASHRDSALEARRNTYASLASLGCRIIASAAGGSISPVAAAPKVVHLLARNERVRIYVDGGTRPLVVSCSKVFFKTSKENADAAIRSTSPSELLNWISTVRADACEQCAPGFDADLASGEALLAKLIKSETTLLDNSRAYLETLDHGLSFDFLAGESYEWIIHLTVFSWIGVIMAAFAQLVVGINDRKSMGLSFVFISLRFITAPVIAFIFVATITYGLTDEPVALNHAPLFVVFAFATGYLSESFNLMLREGLNKLIPSWGINADKLKGAADLEAAARKILTQPKQRLRPASTLPELEKSLRADTANAVAELEARAAEKVTY